MAVGQARVVELLDNVHHEMLDSIVCSNHVYETV